MKFSTLFAIALCALLPVMSYIVVKNYTDDNVKMPQRFFYDGILRDTVDGKVKVEKIWHKVKNLKMVNQFGDTVELDDLKGKVLLVNFFFTSCPTICPVLTTNLRKVQRTIERDSSMHIVSITMDPKRDSTQALFKYANQYGVKHDNWWMCRLVEDSLDQVMRNEFKAIQPTDDSHGGINHTADVFLLDRNRVMRVRDTSMMVTEEHPQIERYYNGMDTTDMFYLLNDAGLVKMERTVRNKPPFNILIASIGLMTIVGLYILYTRKKNKKPF